MSRAEAWHFVSKLARDRGHNDDFTKMLLIEDDPGKVASFLEAVTAQPLASPNLAEARLKPGSRPETLEADFVDRRGTS